MCVCGRGVLIKTSGATATKKVIGTMGRGVKDLDGLMYVEKGAKSLDGFGVDRKGSGGKG